MRILDNERIAAFKQHLEEEEHMDSTMSKYIHAIQELMRWLDGKEVSKTAVVAWKAHIMNQHYAPSTINGMLTAANVFFKFAGWQDCCVKTLRLQRQTFRDNSRELNRGEYEKLISTAIALGKTLLALVIESIGSTGIRVSETCYITVEAVRNGKAIVNLKGKIRTILLPSQLCRKLLQYAKKQKIDKGAIFLNRNGQPLSRQTIWAGMKSISKAAGVEASKVFPNNLRHLFAKEFYRVCHDIVRLADVLGHSSIETTRIYLITTGVEHARILESLKLVS